MLKVFPELKESEDERIKKWLINYFREVCDNVAEKEKNAVLSWLEKQGEQKPQGKSALEAINEEKVDNANKVEPRQEELTEFERAVKQVMEEAIECGDTHNLKADAEMLLNLAQKSAWSEEDDSKLNWFEKFFRPESLITKCKDIPQDKYLWFKSLKDRVQPQQKQEWNEDTQQWIDAIIFDYEFWYDEDKDHRTTIQAKINILKSLKERYSWKPSDEQIKGIECAIKTLRHQLNVGDKRLNSLYEDLKKLKEE